MVRRCHKKQNPAYERYGGRGITVCERWQHFPNFLADMGERPAGYTLERIDNNKGYTPDNCRWDHAPSRAVTSGTMCFSALMGKPFL
jgi:hypothetical protein